MVLIDYSGNRCIQDPDGVPSARAHYTINGSGNSSGASGGGVYSRGGSALTNATISGNISRDRGGGVFTGFNDITVDHTTITGNQATGGGGVFADRGGVRGFGSIIAGNTAPTNPDLHSGANSFLLDYTLIGDAAGTSLIEAQTPDPRGNLIGNSAGTGVIDPRLAPLADNGGSTQTHALLAGSPAIDANRFAPFPMPKHDYQLNGTLADALGGPSLMALGGTLTATLYASGSNLGLNATPTLTNPANYTLELNFLWTHLTGSWQKIVDFHNLTSNVGLYAVGNGLHFVNGPFEANVFTQLEFARFVLTRDDATNIVRAYLDGVEIWSFIDTAGDAVFNGPNQIIRFFQDDTVTGQIETGAGHVDSIRIYDVALTPAQVSMLPDPITIPAFDQRGMPFARVRDGDADGTAHSDMGAFELQNPLVLDFGDAPDTSTGTGMGNYNTSVIDNGPSHAIVPGLRMGASADSDIGTLQNSAANADDVNGALPDDEDAVSNPAADLVLTVGAQPTLNVRVTNTTAALATLYGWIDYDADGVFENGTERASVSVANGTNNGVVTLEFPTVPPGFTGTSCARFRLSTDAAAADPVGPASDGEVEDERVTIVQSSDGRADDSKTKKIASETGGGPALVNGDMFGASVAAIGDLDGDGVEDMAVGAPSQTGSGSTGAVFVQFMNANGTVKSSQKIANGIGGGPAIAAGDYFGHSVASVGDLDGDGVSDLAVGASKDDTDGYISGAVYVLFMNTDGTVKASQKIASGIGGGPPLVTRDRFGSAVASIGDLDGDEITDLAVGAAGDDTGGSYRGAVYVLFMNASGTVKASQKIASGIGGGPLLGNYDRFGRSITSLGDVDGDGVSDIAVGAIGDGGQYRGAVHILFMKADGTVKGSQKIGNGVGGGPPIGTTDFFGTSVAGLGDIDCDGVPDLAVGATGDDSVIENSGAAHLFFLNESGTAKMRKEIGNGIGGGPILSSDSFGSSVASLGDIDGNGVTDLAVGATHDDTGATVVSDRGAVHILLLNANGDVASSRKIASNTGGGPVLSIQYFGEAVASLGDLDGDGLVNLAVGGRDSIRP
jgi:hypothetical protein